MYPAELILVVVERCRLFVKYTLLLTACLPLLWNCSLVDTMRTPSPEKVDTLVEQNRFRDALQMIDKARQRSKTEIEKDQWQQRYAAVSAAADNFQTVEFDAIKSLMASDNWFEANEKQRFISLHLPVSQALSVFSANYFRQRQVHIDSLNSDLLLLDAKQIPESLKIYELIYRADDQNAAAFDRLQRARDGRDQSLLALQKLVAQAEHKQNYQLALVYARAMQRMRDSPDVLAKIQDLRKDLSQRGDVGRVKAALTARQKKQLATYGKLLLEEEWVEARKLLNTMLAERPSDGELLGQDTYLKELFVRQIAEAKAQGESLYSAGEIEAALASWLSVAEMAKDDLELAANIKRAERILNKVQALKSQSQGETSSPDEPQHSVETLESSTE